MSEQTYIPDIFFRIGLQSLVLVGMLTLPMPYVVGIGVVGIIVFGMYEIVFGGVLFDVVHAVPFTSLPVGNYPLTALFLVCVSCALVARATLSRTYFLSRHS
jgi:hypothetical protein